MADDATQPRSSATPGLHTTATPAVANDPLFVRARAPLRAADAVAAILVCDDGRYVMQLRDPLEHIFYPDHWGCFGGAVNAGESPIEALRREIVEELEYEVTEATPFTRFEFDFSRVGGGPVYREFFEVRVSRAALDSFVLHEGAAFEAVAADELLARRRVTPYDAFAIWMHASRDRLATTERQR